MDRLLGDFVKDQAPDGYLGLEHLAEVPTDGLALAIFIGSQEEFFGIFQQRFELADLLGLVAGDDVDGIEVFMDVHTQVGPVLTLVLLGDFLGPLG